MLVKLGPSSLGIVHKIVPHENFIHPRKKLDDHFEEKKVHQAADQRILGE